MKVYSAGVFNTIPRGRIDAFQEMVGIQHYPILESFHYRRSVELAIEYGVKDLFLDSGAFSAFSLCKEIDIHAYIDFINKNRSSFTVIAALDAIGDTEKTWDNIQLMESEGIKPLPVFHYLSNFDALDMCKEYDYFALGGLVPIAAQQRKLVGWLDRCWERIVDANGNPTHNVHGFGMTGQKVMVRYPWYSVDSSSWLRGGQGGAILIQEKNKTRSIVMADNSPSVKEFDNHYDTLAVVEQDLVRERIEREGLFTVEQLREDHWSRRAFNIREINLWERSRKEAIFIKQEQGLFD